MVGPNMNPLNFRVSTGILSRLGEELAPNREQGIVELVKNAYDADARKCTVEIRNTEGGSQSVVVSDDGIGMTIKDIRDGWLVIGKSKKAGLLTTQLGRLPVGDKGLGRLAAIRQGSSVSLRTRPSSEPSTEYRITINWDDFSRASIVEDISIPITSHQTTEQHGTDISVENLAIRLREHEVYSLARELVLLADPFRDLADFKPKLIAPEFTELEALVQDAFFEDAEYQLHGSLSDTGHAQAVLLDWKGKELARANHNELSDKIYQTIPATFDLWVFLLNSKTFSSRKGALADVRKWLSAVGGVHLYHRGLRVRPYGDSGHDWLEMNLRRARSPEERPSTNTSLGKLVVADSEDILVQKTDRIGFIEDEAFTELRRFATDALDWMANVRLRMAEQKREQTKQEAIRSVKKEKARLDEVLANHIHEEGSRALIKRSVQEYEDALQRNVISLREELQLYRSLATAGTTSAVFAHESGKSVTLVRKIAEEIDHAAKLYAGNSYGLLEKRISRLIQVSDALSSFAKFPLYLLNREKRRSGVVDVQSTIKGIVDLFEPFFTKAKINVPQDGFNNKVYITGSIALLEAIITNLLTNSINAFNVSGARTEGREISIQTSVSNKYVVLRVLDNGLGISGLTIDEIWLPGRTTTPGGTGFGLTIVKDSVGDLGGKVQAIANGELGGAEFVISLPLTSGK